jgi:hypothetical protein
MDLHIRDIRVRLAEALAFSEPDLARYQFHITLGYLLEWLDEDETNVFFRLYKNWVEHLTLALHSLPIGPPALCTFKDMFAFEPIIALAD